MSETIMTLPLAGNRTLFFGKDVDMESIESISQEIVKINIIRINLIDIN